MTAQMVPCFICDGEGRIDISEPGDTCRETGARIEHWIKCENCNGTGGVTVEDEPADALTDLDERAPVIAGSPYLNRPLRTLAQARAEIEEK